MNLFLKEKNKIQELMLKNMFINQEFLKKITKKLNRYQESK